MFAAPTLTKAKKVLWTVAGWLSPAVCVVVPLLWLLNTTPPRPAAPPRAPAPSTVLLGLPGTSSGEVLTIPTDPDAMREEHQLQSQATMFLSQGRYEDAERAARLCVERFPSNKECAYVLIQLQSPP
jgi:hypothetical protein